MGASHNHIKSGALGNAAGFSFFPTKNLGAAGDGGMLATSDEEILDKVKILRAHGSKITYEHDVVGYNSRLDEIQAAILRVKLKHLPKPFHKVSRSLTVSDVVSGASEESRIIPLDDLEKKAIEMALLKYHGNISITAKKLAIGQATLYRKVKKYGLAVD